jgi:PAS domain S-box-containing protein
VNYSKKSKEELIEELTFLRKKEDNSKKNYKDLFDNSPDLLYIQSRDGKFIDVNKAVLKKYGYKKEDILKKTPYFLAAPKKNDLKSVGEKIELAWRGKKQTFEFWAKKKDGTIFPKQMTIRKGNYFNKEVIISSGRDITNQKIAEQHLKENEEKYRNIFTKNLAGVFITEKGKILDCNNSFALIFGYKSRVQLIGKSVYDLYYSKKDRDNYIKDLKKNKNLSNYRNRQKNKKGEEIWILTNVTLKNKDRVEGTLVDITEQVKAERKLKQSEKNYKELSENSPYGIFVHINGNIIYGNREAYKIWGIKEKSVKKISIYDFILPENKKEVIKRTKEALLRKNIPFKEFKIKKPFTNKETYIESKPMFYDFQGKKAVQVVFSDVTHEKELNKEKIRATIAEESNKILQKEIKERNKIEKKLIENQEYTKSIINSSLDIICSSDKSGKIIEFNAAAEQAFGYKEEEVKDKGVQLIYASKKEFLEVSNQLKSKGYFVGEVKNKRKNGEFFTSFLSASVLYNQEEEQIGTMGVSRDITELKEAEQQLIDSEEKYRDLFENASDLIQSMDMNGNIIYVNNTWKKTLGYSEKELEGKNIFDVIHPDCKERCKVLFSKVIKSKEDETNRVSFELKTKKGEKIIVEGSVSLKFNEGKPVSTLSILRNVTEEKWKNTKQSVYNEIAGIITEKTTPEDIYEGIRLSLGNVMNTDVFIISFLLEKETLTFPYYYEGKKGRIIKENRKKGNGINEYFLKQKKAKLLKRKELDKIIGEESYHLLGEKCQSFIGVPLKIKNKIVGVLSVQSYENENEFDEKSVEILDFISGALALAVQRKIDENKIFEQSARLKSIIESNSHMFWTFDIEKGITSFNKAFSDEIFRTYGTKPRLGSEKKEQNKASKKDGDKEFWDKQYKEAFKGKTVDFTIENTSPKGERIIRGVVLNPIFNEDNTITELSGISHDVTDKTIAEEELKASLSEKEVLLKEVHHRVKNNLQVISSILNLQSSYVKEENTLNILRESQNRIKSMAFIHESLYQTTDFSKINFSEYITSLSKNLVHSYGAYDNLVDLKLLLRDVSLNLDLSIPCGLILNELVSNSLKYAFADKKNGIIKIELFEKNDNVNLIVEDNGLGLPKNIDYKNTDSLGLQLVMTLTEQINGTIKLENKGGARYTITFKKEQ